MKNVLQRFLKGVKKQIVGDQFRQAVKKNEQAAAELDAIVRKVLQK